MMRFVSACILGASVWLASMALPDASERRHHDSVIGIALQGNPAAQPLNGLPKDPELDSRSTEPAKPAGEMAARIEAPTRAVPVPNRRSVRGVTQKVARLEPVKERSLPRPRPRRIANNRVTPAKRLANNVDRVRVTPIVTMAPTSIDRVSDLELISTPDTTATRVATTGHPGPVLSGKRPATDPLKRASPSERRAVARNLQRELRRVGCYARYVDGIWGPASIQAARDFSKRIGASVPVESPDYVLLMLVEKFDGNACRPATTLASLDTVAPVVAAAQTTTASQNRATAPRRTVQRPRTARRRQARAQRRAERRRAIRRKRVATRRRAATPRAYGFSRRSGRNWVRRAFARGN